MPVRLLLPALALALVLTGCDAVSTGSDAVTGDDLEDAAGAIATAVAMDGGGALDDASAAALLTADASKSGDDTRPGCTGDRTYDEAASLWRSTISCERGNPDGRFYHTFSRTTTHQFFDASGTPQQSPQDAASVAFTILDGTGEHLTPRASAVLSDLGASLDIVRLDDEMVSVDGVYDREGVHTVYGRGDAEREVDYSLSLDLDEVTGPRRVRNRWASAVSGSISGVYTATVTVTTPGGETRTRDIDRSFTITFPTDGNARRARIAIGGRTFDADPVTGELL